MCVTEGKDPLRRKCAQRGRMGTDADLDVEGGDGETDADAESIGDV